jgi:hypothetical protein
MVVAHIRIAPLTSTDAVEPSVLRNLIYAHAPPRYGVEHIRCRAGPHGFDILAFVDSNDPEAANVILHRLVSNAISHTSLLRHWRII